MINVKLLDIALCCDGGTNLKHYYIRCSINKKEYVFKPYKKSCKTGLKTYLLLDLLAREAIYLDILSLEQKCLL